MSKRNRFSFQYPLTQFLSKDIVIASNMTGCLSP